MTVFECKTHFVVRVAKKLRGIRMRRREKIIARTATGAGVRRRKKKMEIGRGGNSDARNNRPEGAQDGVVVKRPDLHGVGVKTEKVGRSGRRYRAGGMDDMLECVGVGICKGFL
jgi:hypothetical protein